MRWWKRLIFSILSAVLGFCSLDYLIYAFRLLANKRNISGKYDPKSDAFWQLAGLGLFLLWFVIVAFYMYLIRRSSSQIDIIESDVKKGKERVRRRWFDLIFQGGILFTGLIARWCYLIYFYLPNR